MRINVVTSPFHSVPPAPCGAMERVWKDLAIEFAKAGHEVTLYCRRHAEWPSDTTRHGVRFRPRMRLKQTKSIYFDIVQDFFYSLRVALAAPPADMFVTNTFWMPWLLRFFRTKGRAVVSVNRWPKKQFRLYRRVAMLAAASRAIAGEIRRQEPSVSHLIHVVPNPIDAAAFVPPALPRRRKEDYLVLMYHGRIHPEKGIDLLLHAFEIARVRHPQLCLRVIGDHRVERGGGGEAYKAQLQAKAAALPVEILPPIYDRPALVAALHDADLYAYPSLAKQGEAFGVSPVEAMATGLPVVVSGLEVFRDFLDDGRTGLVFDHEQSHAAEALAACVVRLIEDPAFADRLGAAAADRGRLFGNAHVARQFLEHFQKMVNSGSCGSAARPVYSD